MVNLLEHYEGILTNGLDLISFILVTPELARVSGVTTRILAYLLMVPIYIVATVGVYLVPYAVASRMNAVWAGAVNNEWAILAIAIIGTLLLAVWGNVFAPILLNKLDELSRNATRHVFAFGMATFLTSRLIALAVAIQRLEKGIDTSRWPPGAGSRSTTASR